MKANIIKILWGIVLIFLGGLSLADGLGYVDMGLISHLGWSLTIGVISAIFFACYLLDGLKKWGWLFPAFIFAALAMVISRILDNYSGSMIAMPIVLSIAIPFYIGYIIDRKQWGLLIPAWVITVVSAILVLSDGIHSDLIGAIVLYAIALPFIVVYLINHQFKWALIVGMVLAFIGLFPLLTLILPYEAEGPVVMAIFTLFFVLIYFITNKGWWAIIPAGIFASIGAVALLNILFPINEYFMFVGLDFGVYTGVLLLGISATFGILWLLRGNRPTAWARFPAIGLLILSIMSFLMWKTSSDLVPAITLLVFGIAMILMAVMKKRSPNELTSRQT
jgi:hypothetical protein